MASLLERLKEGTRGAANNALGGVKDVGRAIQTGYSTAQNKLQNTMKPAAKAMEGVVDAGANAIEKNTPTGVKKAVENAGETIKRKTQGMP